MKRNLVIFDGSNFYHGVKRLSKNTHLTYFNYRKFVEIITGSKDNKIEYCVGEIRREPKNKVSERLYSNQQALFYHLEKQDLLIKKGFMLKDKVYHEKGVDVRIALDILRGALKDEYGKCFVISSDTDIIPAIIDAKAEGKQIIYVGFSGHISNALKYNCSKTFFITTDMIKKCAK